MRTSAFRFEERQPRDERERSQVGGPRAPHEQHDGREDAVGGVGSPHHQYHGSSGSYDYHHYGSTGKPPMPPNSRGQHHHHHHGGGAYSSASSGHPLPQQQQYSQPYPPHSHLTPRKLRSVVTSSFSIEDECRDDHGQHNHPYRHRRILSNDHHLQHHQSPHQQSRSRQQFAAIDERRNDLAVEREEEGAGHIRQMRERDDSYYALAEFEDAALGKNIPPPAPRAASNNSEQLIQRSFSTGTAKLQSSPSTASSEPMKRNYYHHSRPSDVQTVQSQQQAQVHPDFIPPKRLKVNDSPRAGEVVITPRTPGTAGASGGVEGGGGGAGGGGVMRPPREWVNRAPTWESAEDGDPYGSRFSRAQSFPHQQQNPPCPWSPSSNKAQSPMSSFRYDPQQHQQKDYAHVSPHSDSEPSPRGWHHPGSPDWALSPTSGRNLPNGSMPPYREFWDSSSHSNGNSGGSMTPRGGWDDGTMHRHHEQKPPTGIGSMSYSMSCDSKSQEPMPYQRKPPPPPMYYGAQGGSPHQQALGNGRPGMEDKMQLVMDAAAATAGDVATPLKNLNEPLLLLALPQDRVALSETLCVVREVS